MIKFWSLFLKLTFFVTMVAGCQHAHLLQTPDISQIDDALTVKTSDDKLVSLRCLWMELSSKGSQNTTLIFVPGLGDPSLEGIKVSDGISNYSDRIPVGTKWQKSLVQFGYNVLAYDKRTGTNGPESLAKDLDSACNAVKSRFGKDQKIVLFASDLGTQVILASACKNVASAVIMLSPIPDALDSQWTLALKEAGHLHKANSLAATFEAIWGELFEKDAKVMGESLAFWKNWLTLSKSTFKNLSALKTPILFLAGQNDPYLGRNGKQLLEKLCKNNKNRKFIEISNADRHLLQGEALSRRTIETTVSALRLLVQ